MIVKNHNVEPLLTSLLRNGFSSFDSKLFTCKHPVLPLRIFCYDQHVTYRNEEEEKIAHQCRGLVLEEETWNVVCWGFDKFQSSLKKKKTQSCDGKEKYNIQVKEDGSLLFLFFYKGTWMLTTRHTFCDQPSERIYMETFLEIIGCSLDAFAKDADLSTDFTYCFELCSSKNRIVRKYEKSTLFLLSAFSQVTHNELPQMMLDMLVKHYILRYPHISLQRPLCIAHFETVSFAHCELRKWECQQELFEGFVLLNEITGERVKIKSDFYRNVHTLRYRGWTSATPIMLVPLIINDLVSSGKRGIVLSLLSEKRHDFAEFQERWSYVEMILQKQIDELSNEWKFLRKRDDFFSLDYNILKNWVHERNVTLLPLFLKESRKILSSEEPSWPTLIMDHVLLVTNLLFGSESDSHWITKQKGCYCSDWSLFEKSEMAHKIPYETEDGKWVVFCCCGEKMTCKRLPYDYLFYQQCPCPRKEYVDVLTYASGSLLWICENCGCTHECYQRDDIFDDGKKVKQGQPLGIPASKELKNFRLFLHFIMKQKMKFLAWKKSKMYDFICKTLQVPKEKGHVALFGYEDCKIVLQHLSNL